MEELNGKEIDGRAIRVDIAAGRDDSNKQKTERRANAFGDQQSPPADTLFIGNLPFTANEDSLYEMFAEYGSVQSVRLPTDRETGAPKGFGKSARSECSCSITALTTRLPLVCFH